MTEQIIILDFGSQYTQVIARRVRECNVYSTILRYDTPAKKIAALKPSGIILSGGPSSVYDTKAPLPDKGIFKLGVPMLGVCYGVQIFAHFLGGRVEKWQKREYGKGTLTVVDRSCALFRHLPAKLQVWNSHGDKITRLPKDFLVVGTTENSDYAAMEHPEKNSSAFNFTPKSSTRRGVVKSTATSSTASAAAARIGQCAITSSKPSRPSANRSVARK
jgi:GMP synthase (glutamine-hydrolysing)